ncbi:MAG: dephospho-CoA kinase [Firmicutes bacterium]|nr:dephospho-CoA kinase [Bacillota bacterium]
MRVLGLTGGIGSGKSTAAAVLAGMGVPVVDADQVARRLQQRGAPGWRRVRELFGWPVLRADGELDRPRLARWIFTDPQQRARLDAALHPLIGAAIREDLQELEAHGADTAVLVAPLLFESGLDRLCRQVWVVEAPLALILERLRARGLAEADARARMAAQMAPAERRRRAQLVIPNGGSREELAARVQAAWQRFQEDAR